jgi:hypothetical protein
LNPARGHRPQPGPGLSGFDVLADLEMPLPDVGFDGGCDAVLNAFVNHETSHQGLRRDNISRVCSIRETTGRRKRRADAIRLPWEHAAAAPDRSWKSQQPPVLDGDADKSHLNMQDASGASTSDG